MAPDFAATERLGRRVEGGTWRGRPAVRKSAQGDAELDRLANEARVLRALDGLHAPRLLAAERRSLVLERADGRPLPPDTAPAPDLYAALAAALGDIHALGWVHCDIKPSNILIGASGAIRFLDWEHALPVGTDLASCPQRAWSPGRSHPNLIWGRGRAAPDLDLWSLARLCPP